MWLVTYICRYKFTLNKARSEINYKLAMFLVETFYIFAAFLSSLPSLW